MAKTFHLSCQCCGAAIETTCATTLYCPSCRKEKRRETKRRSRKGLTVKQGAPREIVCEQCGTTFTGYGAAAHYCPACKEERGRGYRREYAKTEKCKAAQKRWKDKNRERLREIERKYRTENREKFLATKREYMRRRREMQRDPLEALKKAVRQNLPGAKLALARAEGKLTFCERMRLTAYPLPCGTREECRGCEHCPKGADFGWQERQRDYNYTGGWY